MPEKTFEEGPRLYNKLTIVIFSILLSTFFGGIIYSQNLIETGQKKQITSVLLFCIVWNAIAFKLAYKYTDNFLLTFVLPNFIGSLLLIKPFWEHHFKDFNSFKSRNVWMPLIVVLIISTVLLVLKFYYN